MNSQMLWWPTHKIKSVNIKSLEWDGVHELWKAMDRQLLAFGEGESVFFMGVAGRLTKLQWMASKPKVYEQHKLEMIN